MPPVSRFYSGGIMNDSTSVWIGILGSVLGFAGGGISSYFVFRGQKLNTSVQAKSANAQQVEVIFGGYSQMVEDLHAELGRMREIIDELRAEQEACEARNSALEQEIVELRTRISNLEKKEEAHHGD